MVAVSMLYATVVGLLVMAAAAALEHPQRSRGRARWVWATGFLIALALPFVRDPLLASWNALLAGFGASVGAPLADLGSIEVIGAPAVVAALAPWDAGLLLLWVVASATLLLGLSLGVLRMRRARGQWRAEDLDGLSVLVSERVGPAVVGIRRPEIVLPAWAVALPHEERSMILRHENEHRLARDPALLSAGLAAAILMPWNAALWWGFSRLRHAVETDCDRRVLTHQAPSASSYARLLLHVGTHQGSRIPLGAGFGERRSSLEHRIRALLVEPTGRLRTTAGRVLVAGFLFAGSCSLSSPDAGLLTDIQMSEVPTLEGEEPRFTPFTVAPSIVNRSDVVQAMSDEYPPLLRDAGIGGQVGVFFYVDARGEVRDVRVEESSGHPALDAAALAVASVYRFSPALNRDAPVPVWVQFTITFQPG